MYLNVRGLKYSWSSTLATDWAKTFSKGLDKTIHTEAEKMDQAFAGLDLILRKWLRIWRQTAIHMKEVPTKLFVIVSKEKETPKQQFSKHSWKRREILRWSSKGQDGTPSCQADFGEKSHVKGGTFLELFIFDIWSIDWCPPREVKTLTLNQCPVVGIPLNSPVNPRVVWLNSSGSHTSSIPTLCWCITRFVKFGVSLLRES